MEKVEIEQEIQNKKELIDRIANEIAKLQIMLLDIEDKEEASASSSLTSLPRLLKD